MSNNKSPADTSMMRIVHNAIRRDLVRSHEALGAPLPPGERQRVAIARQLLWVMQLIRAHHASEDHGLYPLIRVRQPTAAPLLDAMADDHAAIATRIDDLEQAARAYEETDETDQRDGLSRAVEQLEEVLLPHLRREEDDVMPIVATTITDVEWREIEHEHNLKHKSLAQLGLEGHWLIDDASPADREKVLGLVPTIPRFVLVHGFAHSYRRRKAACWQPSHPTRRVQKQGRSEIVVKADLDALWSIVRDPTRVGEWSHECQDISWLGGATSAAPGARFRGHNKQRIFRWDRVCEIVVAEPYEIIWRTVPTTLYPDSTIWRIGLQPTVDGTRIEQTFRVVRAPRGFDLLYGALVPAHRDRTAALTEDLHRLGALAEQASPIRRVA